MRVQIIAHTPEPEQVVAAAARLCYSQVGAEKLLERLTLQEVDKLLYRLEESGHLSPFEHVSFTFSIGGVSRALSHQLVRHRIASYSQQSQRYVSQKQFNYITPPSLEGETLEVFNRQMEFLQEAYTKLVALGIPREDARYLLPNACETKLVVTMNCRSLYNFFELRCCQRAQWEIRELASKMLELVQKVAPRLFAHAGPTCVARNYCREGEHSCGRIHARSN
jgi:thymidylate synthase (FAD)